MSLVRVLRWSCSGELDVPLRKTHKRHHVYSPVRTSGVHKRPLRAVYSLDLAETKKRSDLKVGDGGEATF